VQGAYYRTSGSARSLLVPDSLRQQGVGGSLQVGWSHCRGSYIARLDADDEVRAAGVNGDGG
jgi:glycosyltransferase involved in cell wall biosynthesis